MASPARLIFRVLTPQKGCRLPDAFWKRTKDPDVVVEYDRDWCVLASPCFAADARVRQFGSVCCDPSARIRPSSVWQLAWRGRCQSLLPRAADHRSPQSLEAIRFGCHRATSLREEFNRTWDRRRGKAALTRRIWALRDCRSTCSKRGRRIIVPQRRGKSTLLKNLTIPTHERHRRRRRRWPHCTKGHRFSSELTGARLFPDGAISQTRAKCQIHNRRRLRGRSVHRTR